MDQLICRIQQGIVKHLKIRQTCYDLSVISLENRPDFSELMFNEATKRNMSHIVHNKAELRHGDYLDSETISDLYNKTFCINVVNFWNSLLEPFSKIHAELKEDGIFSILYGSSG